MKDENGKQILYPRVGADNSSESDVPIRLDEDGIPLMMKARGSAS